MNLEKIKELIEILESESKQKIFIKELKTSTVSNLILNLEVRLFIDFLKKKFFEITALRIYILNYQN